MKNQVLETINQRRSVRSFTSEPVQAHDLTAILEAGRWAPSGMNNQPWRFAVVESPDKKNELAGGSSDVLVKSVRDKVFPLGDQTRVLPGHGPVTAVGQEKRFNPFLKGVRL